MTSFFFPWFHSPFIPFCPSFCLSPLLSLSILVLELVPASVVRAINDTCKLESKKERNNLNKPSLIFSDKSSSSSDHCYGSTDEQQTRYNNDTFLFPDVASLHHHHNVEYLHDPLTHRSYANDLVSIRKVVNHLDAPPLSGLRSAGEEKGTGAGTGTGKVPHPDDFRRRLVPHADIFSRPLPVFLPPPDDAEVIEATKVSGIINDSDTHIKSTSQRDSSNGNSIDFNMSTNGNDISDENKCNYYPVLIYEMIGGVMCVFNEKDRNERIQKRNVSNITSNNNSDKSHHDDDDCCHGDSDDVIENYINSYHENSSMSVSNLDNPSSSERFSVSNSSNMSKNNSEMRGHNEEMIRKNRQIGNLFPVLGVDEFVEDFNYVSNYGIRY